MVSDASMSVNMPMAKTSKPKRNIPMNSPVATSEESAIVAVIWRLYVLILFVSRKSILIGKF